MTTDPHTYEGKHNRLTITPTFDPGVVDVDLFNRAERRGFWMEVPVGKLRSMIDASTPTPADDMDGGVTAALIEKEAESCPEDCDYRAAHGRLVKTYRETVARAEQAELDRDKAGHGLTRLARALDLPDVTTVGDMIARIEEINRHDCIRDAAVIREPLTPEDITPGMMARFIDAYTSTSGSAGTAIRAGVKAMLTEPAEDPEVVALAEVLGDFAIADEHSGDRDDMILARRLHERGVRVTAEEQP